MSGRFLRKAATLGLFLLSSGCLGSGKGALPGAFSPISVEATDEQSPHFVRSGEPFCFAGTNNYYLMYKGEAAVVDFLDAAVEMKLKVIRTWAFLDRGSLDGSVPSIHGEGHKDGVYFQYWDPAANAPAYNEGKDGLERLDFILHEARKRDLLVLLVLTNNWRDFGGMDQYLTWFGLSEHHLFYTEPRVKAAYKDWLSHLVQRTNTIDGTPYQSDEAIFAWELANEPRTINYKGFDSKSGWDGSTIPTWAAEMASHLKELDPNHLVSVGDEGFLSGQAGVFGYDAPYGVDNKKLTELSSVDFGTYHLYPDHWGTDAAWSYQWITDHVELGRKLNKPMLLEEYGIRAKRSAKAGGPLTSFAEKRKSAYDNWNRLVLKQGGAGALFWMLLGDEAPGRAYPDYDGFGIYRHDDAFGQLTQLAQDFSTGARACELRPSDDKPSASAASRYVTVQKVARAP